LAHSRESANIDAPDSVADHQGVAPPKNGTMIRIIDILRNPPIQASASDKPPRHSVNYFPMPIIAWKTNAIPACTSRKVWTMR